MKTISNNIECGPTILNESENKKIKVAVQEAHTRANQNNKQNSQPRLSPVDASFHLNVNFAFDANFDLNPNSRLRIYFLFRR